MYAADDSQIMALLNTLEYINPDKDVFAQRIGDNTWEIYVQFDNESLDGFMMRLRNEGF
jgi:hypothetical protein